MCTNPSWWTPTSTKAPNAATFVTTNRQAGGRADALNLICRARASRPLKKSRAVRGEDGVVTIVERPLDFEGAIVLQFGRAIARDLVAFVEAVPSEKDDSSAIFDFGGGRDGTEGKFCPNLWLETLHRGPGLNQ